VKSGLISIQSTAERAGPACRHQIGEIPPGRFVLEVKISGVYVFEFEDVCWMDIRLSNGSTCWTHTDTAHFLLTRWFAPAYSRCRQVTQFVKTLVGRSFQGLNRHDFCDRSTPGRQDSSSCCSSDDGKTCFVFLPVLASAALRHNA
jgi:hypothetical protein